MAGVDVAGDVLAEAVIADEAARGGGAKPAAQAGPSHCANCDAALQGAFCHVCGQKAQLHRSLRHLGEQGLQGVMHFDSRLWRTLPALLFQPGRLTREYIAGRRVRYVSPLALYLFLVFLMFFVFSLTGSDMSFVSSDSAAPSGTPTEIAAELEEARARLAALQARLEQLPAGEAKGQDLREELNEQIASQERKSQRLEKRLRKAEARAQGQPDTSDAPLTEARLHEELSRNMPGLANSTLEKRILHAVENHELTLYKMKSGAAKFAFLVLPISLPFIWLLFVFKRRFTLFDHAVFALYSLSAMALMMSALALFDVLGLQWAMGLLICFGPPLHMYAQLRGTYALGRWGAAWRTLFLLIIACIVLTLYMLLVAALSV
ncbi:DUF3667 domain-containing protein [Roseateles violae]|uniref:DUF3667 domain-containing protein n=1 Tax=Roseateles violae TaxID=3058042 RepID=A0ABT8DZ17_9BURK|nr:DUF3667 domain-containing protein [Pelomonas sp. PFR6]MDN3922832.1 DUF3667 domain-containing protein [Pelomonas sp. PFR6]